MEDPTSITNPPGEKRTSSETHATSSYPVPFTVAALSEHKQSLILLHGRGDNGERFGIELVQHRISRTDEDNHVRATIKTAFPHMKFIFPTTKRRRARWYNRAMINQWFDNVPIDEQDRHHVTREQEEWQLEGLRETRDFLKAIVDEEANLLGAENVFIGGLSQGCAMALHFLLSYDIDNSTADLGVGTALGGFIGMSGWLPFAKDVEQLLESPFSHSNDEADNDDDPFATADAEPSPSPSSATEVCNFIRDNMDLSLISRPHPPTFLKTPVFLGHGVDDNKVKIAKGRQVAQVLRRLGMQDVCWREYDEGHWYKVPEELNDIADFLRSQLNIDD